MQEKVAMHSQSLSTYVLHAVSNSKLVGPSLHLTFQISSLHDLKM